MLKNFEEGAVIKSYNERRAYQNGVQFEASVNKIIQKAELQRATNDKSLHDLKVFVENNNAVLDGIINEMQNILRLNHE